MTGTLVNCVAVIIGGLIGLLLKKGIKPNYAEGINKSLGIAVLIIGLNGVVSNMFIVENGSLKSSGELLLIVFQKTHKYFVNLKEKIMSILFNCFRNRKKINKCNN